MNLRRQPTVSPEPFLRSSSLKSESVLPLLLLLSLQPVLLDRLVANVGGQPIMLSDLRAARALELVPGASSLDDRTLTERLIDRELMRAEVDRFSMTVPDRAEVEARLEEVQRRLPEGLERTVALDRLGLSPGRLRAWIEDDLRIERYLQQRFEAAAQPSDEEVLTFYRSHEREFLKDGRPQPFEVVREEARARLAAERRAALIAEWLAGLRRRATVVLVGADTQSGS